VSVTFASGFVAAGIPCGIKASGQRDLALVATEDGAAVPVAAVFTSNKAAAAPVQVSRAHLAISGGRAAAVVISSGNANAATGERGRTDARRMAGLVGEGLGCPAREVLVCSTGLIGYYLPMDRLEAGIPELVKARGGSDEVSMEAAHAILTTDSRPRLAVADGGTFRVGGMAKGAAMLAPDMATMLAVITTDAAAEPAELQEILRRGVERSFNSLTVDGCTSTNDTVILMASGRAGRTDPTVLSDSVAQVCRDLAMQMAEDAEGATRTAVIRVTGSVDDAQAAAGARRVADSQLVQCSLHGADPYWGRVVSELGSAGLEFDIDRVSIAYGGIVVCRNGVAADHDAEALHRYMRGPRIDIQADLGLGPGRAAILTTDLSEEYIAENERTS